LVRESVTDLDAAVAPAVASQDPPGDQIAAALVVIAIIVGIATVGVWAEKAESAPAKSASAKAKSATVKAAATCVKATSSAVESASAVEPATSESATSVPAASTASKCPGR
jgi:hypothetical protein